ncbi:MAG: hypothetical protein HYT11_01590, partial [Candidatus Levybacteria bacterium]|nr:hypothetical protein [Candidatus Levybacteria bacterium]
MRYFYVVIFYVLIGLVKIGDFIVGSVLFLTNFSKKTDRIVSRTYLKMRKNKRLILSRLRIKYNSYRNIFSFISTWKHRNIGLLIKRIKGKLKRKPKKKSTVFFPLPLHIKMRYFILGALFSFFALYLPILTFLFLQELPNPQILTLRQLPQTTKILDRNGTLLYEIYASENRTVVPLE